MILNAIPPLDPDARPSRYRFIGGNLYQDGIKVLPWQLTDEEVFQLVPKEYWRSYLKEHLPCPFDGCLYPLPNNENLKRSWTTHTRTAHKKWFEMWGKYIQGFTDYSQFASFVTEKQNQDQDQVTE
jgi:hypothetical protein